MSRKGEFGSSHSGSYGTPSYSNVIGSRQPVRPYYDDEPSAGYQSTTYGNFQQLVEKVSSDIFTVTNNASALERASKQIGTDKDSQELRSKIHSTQQQTNGVIAETAQNFHRLMKLASSEKEKKLTVNRLKSQFEETLQRYNTLQKKAAEKAKSAALLPKSATGHLETGWKDDASPWSDAEYEKEREDKRQLLQQQQQVIEDDLAQIEEREERIRELEADILDINEIFRDLGTMVYEQKDMIDNIEDNVVRASDQVEAGTTQLQKASGYQKSARKKMCILLIILLVVGGVLALIITLSIKK